jgi:hypothetical protein
LPSNGWWVVARIVCYYVAHASVRCDARPAPLRSLHQHRRKAESTSTYATAPGASGSGHQQRNSRAGAARTPRLVCVVVDLPSNFASTRELDGRRCNVVVIPTGDSKEIWHEAHYDYDPWPRSVTSLSYLLLQMLASTAGLRTCWGKCSPCRDPPGGGSCGETSTHCNLTSGSQLSSLTAEVPSLPSCGNRTLFC